MLVQIQSYDSIVQNAKNYFSSLVEDGADINSTNESLNKYFECGRRTNPCVARMGLQQAQTDTLMDLKISYELGDITYDDYKSKSKKILKSVYLINNDSRFKELEKRIKNIYKKSAEKRLSIIPGILDSTTLGLASSKEVKVLKKFNYILRKFFTK